MYPVDASAACRRQERRRHALRRDERGAVSTELAVAIPLLMLLILLIAQFAVWAHATHVAQAAASQALSAARVQGGTEATGHAAAHAVLAQLGDSVLNGGHTNVTRGPETTTVEVHGTASRVVPLLSLPVHARAVGPTERFVLIETEP